MNEINEFIFTEHAVIRWNERIGPYSSWQELNNLALNLYLLGRIRFIDDLGVIDDEIVFCYSINSQREVIIQTVLGRLSLKPLLYELDNIRNRYVYLDVPEEVLQEQSLPIINEWERQQLKEIKEQIRYEQLSEIEKKVFLKQEKEMQKNVEVKLNKIKRKKERKERKQQQLAQRKQNQRKNQELLERVQERKMKQRLTLKCSAYSSMVGQDLSSLIQRSDDKEVNVS